MSILLNSYESKQRDEVSYDIRYDIQRIHDQMCDFNIQMKHMDISHQNLIKTVDQIDKNVKEINTRNLKHDTLMALITKLWKLAPYAICAVFFLTLTLTESSFDFSEFMVKFLHKFMGY